MKKIAIVWFWDRASEIFDNWRDGHRAAIEEIGKNHEVHWFLDKQEPDPTMGWDFILFWDDSNSAFFTDIHKYECRKGMILTTDPQNFDNLRQLDVVFVESLPVYEAVRSQGIRTIRAMGTDTDFFKPSKVKKDIKYLCIGTFSPWKRQRDLAYLGKDLYCIGSIQPDGQEDYQAVVDAGATVEVGYFPAEHIRDLYRRAQRVIIPSVHGSERTWLEAASCDILAEILHPEINIRLFSYEKEYLAEKELNPKLTPRQFVVKNYSHKVFAKNLLKGILYA